MEKRGRIGSEKINDIYAFWVSQGGIKSGI
jgi:hypothetical protein